MNYIATVLKENGTYTSSLGKVVNVFIHFYSDLLGKNSPGKAIEIDILKSGSALSENHAMALTRDVLEKEIKEALFLYWG